MHDRVQPQANAAAEGPAGGPPTTRRASACQYVADASALAIATPGSGSRGASPYVLPAAGDHTTTYTQRQCLTCGLEFPPASSFLSFFFLDGKRAGRRRWRRADKSRQPARPGGLGRTRRSPLAVSPPTPIAYPLLGMHPKLDGFLLH